MNMSSQAERVGQVAERVEQVDYVAEHPPLTKPITPVMAAKVMTIAERLRMV